MRTLVVRGVELHFDADIATAGSDSEQALQALGMINNHLDRMAGGARPQLFARGEAEEIIEVESFKDPAKPEAAP